MKIFIAITLVFMATLLSGCPILDELSKQSSGAPQTFKSTDGLCEVIGPGNWKTQPGLHPDAILAVANLREEQYLMVLPQKKSDFVGNMSASQLAGLLIENYKDTSTSEVPIQNATYTQPQLAVVNGKSASRFEIAGTVKGIRANYVITVAEGKDSYYQIVTWTLASKFDKNKPVLVAASDSFRESVAAAPATAKR